MSKLPENLCTFEGSYERQRKHRLDSETDQSSEFYTTGALNQAVAAHRFVVSKFRSFDVAYASSGDGKWFVTPSLFCKRRICARVKERRDCAQRVSNARQCVRWHYLERELERAPPAKECVCVECLTVFFWVVLTTYLRVATCTRTRTRTCTLVAISERIWAL